ncbi:MAG TPA: competence/damage-inducible protein A [Limnochordales bacterium]
MRAEIVSIGTELLLGQIVDTNAAYLARQLSRIGIDCFFRQTVGDNFRRALHCVSLALERSDVVILVGGLGPTDDDITRHVAAAAVGCELQEDPEALAQVEAYFRRLQRVMQPHQRRQALVPAGSRIIPNPNGSAPGFAWQGQGKAVVALPGPPAELQAMVESWVLGFLQELARQRGEARALYSRLLKFAGIGEAALEEALRDLIRAQTNPTLATYAGVGEVSLRVTASAPHREQAQQLVEEMVQRVLARVGQYLYGFDDDTLEAVVVRLLEASGCTLAVAESCTGGLVGDRLTNVPGVSRFFVEGAVVYSNEAKVRRLGVDPAVLAEHGAVSEACARAMAEGVRRTAGADLGLAVTGIAGPTGATDRKPVGLVFVAVTDGGQARVEEHRFPGERRLVKARAAQAALNLLRCFLQDRVGVGKEMPGSARTTSGEGDGREPSRGAG